MSTPADPNKKKPTPGQPADGAGAHDPAAHNPAEDSSIDLGHPVADPRNPSISGSTSGVSVVDWASLVEDPSPTAGPAEPPSFDASSDAEFLFSANTGAQDTMHRPPAAQEAEAEGSSTLLRKSAQESQSAAESTMHRAPAPEEIEGAAEGTILRRPAADEQHGSAEATMMRGPAHHERQGSAEETMMRGPAPQEEQGSAEGTMFRAPAPPEEQGAAESTIIRGPAAPEVKGAGDSTILRQAAAAQEWQTSAEGTMFRAPAPEEVQGVGEETILRRPAPKETERSAKETMFRAPAPKETQAGAEQTMYPGPAAQEQVHAAEQTVKLTPQQAASAAKATLLAGPREVQNAAEATMFAGPAPQEQVHAGEETMHVPPHQAARAAHETMQPGPVEEDSVQAYMQELARGAADTAEAPVIPSTRPSELVRAEAAAFAAPEEVAEDVPFTPESMFQEPKAPSSKKMPALPKMELDSGRKLDGVVELGADAVVTGHTGDIVEVVDDDDAVVAELAEGGPGDSAVLAEVADDEIVEIVESDVNVPPPVPESEVIVAEHESGVDLGAPRSGSHPISSGQVVMEEPDASASGRDLIAEAVESGIDGTLAMPEMNVESDLPGHPGKRKGQRRDDQDATREVHIPSAPPDADDFFTPADSAIVGDGGEVVLGGEVPEETTASGSSSIDLGSMPEMPVLPSKSATSNDAADIDLDALEKAASSSQRGAGKPTARGEIDLGSPSSPGDVITSPGSAEESPVRVDEADIDFAAMESAAGVGAPTSGVVISEESATLQEEEVVEQGAFEEESTAEDGELVGASIGADDEETPKAKKGKKEPKAKGRGGAWIGGTVLGALLGAGACVALVVYDVADSPLKSLRKALGRPDKSAPVANTNKTGGTVNASPAALLASGDHQGARTAAENLQNNEEKNYYLGQIEFRDYARNTAVAAGNDDPKLTTDGAKGAIEKLESAKTPDAYFQLGQIYELTGDGKKAKDSYEKGLAAESDAAKKRRFTAALERLAVQGLTARPRLERDLNVQMALLALLLFAPADAPQSGPAGGDVEEAGYSFWGAVKALNEKDYQTALDKLDAARKAHMKRRLIHMGQQQNPESDPTEQIFVKCVTELKLYWALQEKYKSPGADLEKKILASAGGGNDIGKKLVEVKLIADPKEVNTGIAELLKMREDLAKKLGATDAAKYGETIAVFLKDKGGFDQLVEQGKLLADVAKAVGADKPEDAKAKAMELAADADLVKKLGTKLKAEKVTDKIEKREDVDAAVGKLVLEWKTIPGLKDELDKAKTELTKAQTIVDELYDKLVKLQFLNKDMPKTVTLVLNAIANIIEMHKNDEAMKAVVRTNADLTLKNGKLAKDLKDLDERRVAELAEQDKKNKAEVATLKAEQEKAVTKLNGDHKKEVTGLTDKLAASRTPEQMLSLWPGLLEMRDNKEFAKAAQADADRVLMAADKKKEDEARAKVVLGLALRNEGKYAEAKAKLEEAAKDLPKNDPWAGVVTESLAEATDPIAYYGKRAAELADHNYPDKAIQLLDRMVTAATPEQKGTLLGRRSQLWLEIAMAGGKPVDDGNDNVKKALADAKAGGDAAAAHYALGRVYEETKEMDKALAEFTKAVDLHKAKDADAARYEAAKARALSAPRFGPRRAPEPVKPDAAKVGKLDREDSDESLTDDQRRVALVLLTTLLQPPADAEPTFPVAAEGPAGAATPDQLEAEKIADKVLADPNAPFDARAQAFLIKGRYTDALRTYAEGLQKNRLMRAELASGLMKVIDQHPRLKKRTDFTSNPLEAEVYYGNGLRAYYAGQYADAEKHFTAAVDAVDGPDEDARYYYFLGLSQLGLSKQKEARQSFADGAALERRGMPTRVTVNASLERVQGELRRTLDTERNRIPGQ